ncbi:unnamed protein product [Mytilus coruscus]|uniref:Uncharacterized protein n=1 Tax=Mytilus coruscus TaxID=42192 RepID=A0A6J8DCF2_MYTCO|nr:unnamed protein product [Mytilus coruscus]
MNEISVTEKKVYKLIKNLDPKKAAGPNEKPTKILQIKPAELSPVLTRIFQFSFDTQDVPQDWGDANIVPLYKKGGTYLSATVLGPLLFLTYINDMLGYAQSGVRLFADNTLLYREISDIKDADQLQKYLEELENWEKKWTMRLNQTKCNVICIPQKNKDLVQFIGKYWVHSTVSQNVVPQQEMWMQTKIRTAVRSDTKMSNRSPVLQIKPYQRFLINKTTTINISYIDQDDDIVRCEFSSYGTGNGIKTPKGLSMNKADCIIKFDVPGRIYRVGDTGLILVDVMDFNRYDMVLVSGNHKEIFVAGNSATARSLSAVPLQARCIIHISDNIIN